MEQERRSFSAPQQFLRDAFKAGAYKILRHKSFADEYTDRDMRMAIRYIFTGTSYSELGREFGGIKGGSVGTAVRNFLNDLRNYCPPELQQRYPEPARLLNESLPLPSPRQPTVDKLNYSSAEQDHPLVIKLKEAKNPEEIREIFNRFDYYDYRNLSKLTPPLVYSIGFVVRSCGGVFAPRRIDTYLAKLEDAHISVGLVKRIVRASSSKIEQHYYFIATQDLQSACKVLS